MYLTHKLPRIFVVNFTTFVVGLILISRTSVTLLQLFLFLLVMNLVLAGKMLREYLLFRKTFVSFFRKWRMSSDEAVKSFHEGFTVPLAEACIKEDELQARYSELQRWQKGVLPFNREKGAVEKERAMIIPALEFQKQEVKKMKALWFLRRDLIQARWTSVDIRHFSAEIIKRSISKSTVERELK